MISGMTFGGFLERGERPYIKISATDMGIRRQFSFTQDRFGRLEEIAVR